MKQPTTQDVLRVFWTHARKYRWRAFFILAFTAVAIIMEVSKPWIMKWLFDLLESTASNIATIHLFIPVIAAFILVNSIGWISWRAMAILYNRFQAKVMVDIERSSFEYLLGHSYQFFADTFAGSLVRKVGRLSRAFERMVEEINFNVLPVIIVLVGAVIGLYLQFPLLALIFITWIVVYLYFIVKAARWAVTFDVERARIDSELGGALADAVSNAITIKVFPSLRFEVEKFSGVLRRFSRAYTRSWDWHEIILAVQGALMIALEVVLMYLGVVYWIKGILTLGDLAFIQTYLILVFQKVWEIARSFRHMFDAVADGKEMVEILMTPYAVHDARGAKALRVKRGAIAFTRVRFSFARRPVLEDFSLEIRSGEKMALVGPSGAGKSTIAKLLFRFYDLQGGTIAIDGQDISKVTQDSLREEIALVPQEPILFHRTLMENIRYGRRGATDTEVVEAAKKAHCHEFIASSPKQYQTYVGERGIKLSGGERQRVAIARAIIKNAPILVLDEATSSLDSESESLIQDALRELMRDKTVIVIAHRLSTIMQMDRIAVIEQGRVVSIGTHDELLRARGTYFKLWNIQAGGFAIGSV